MKGCLTSPERAHLRQLQREHRSDGRLYIKITTILMLDQGFSPKEVVGVLGIDRSTVYRHFNDYMEVGLDEYLTFCVGGRDCWLSADQQVELKAHLSETFYQSSKEICEYVVATFGVRYSESGMIKLLHRLDFVYKQTVQVPRHPEPEVQEAFVEELSEKVENLTEEEGLYFMDGVHPQHNTAPDRGWILKGEQMEIPANTGRKRVNINGLMNAQQPTDLTTVVCDRVNAQSTIELLAKLLAENPHKKKFYVVCDNARYYHAKLLKEWLEDKPIELIFLPPYAPNLNLIERLWKFMKKKVINSCYYDTYQKFRTAILAFFDNMEDYREELQSLMNWKFQIIS